MSPDGVLWSLCNVLGTRFLPLVFNSETRSDAEPQPGPSKRLRTGSSNLENHRGYAYWGYHVKKTPLDSTSWLPQSKAKGLHKEENNFIWSYCLYCIREFRQVAFAFLGRVVASPKASGAVFPAPRPPLYLPTVLDV
ncbi:hypothetical protein EVAR_82822_1 [Eumeta japonica]|uniref:Uncharacterized protein n=1 Tax=Eumeta variegata TaxID=151549 RepID=A0A4C1V425_EUMVA|nr:hypothetical protein EVAR_82822_1 [Eumeta japonica]